MVRAAAWAFRENRGVDVNKEITQLAIGEALISVLDEVRRSYSRREDICLPAKSESRPISEIERRAILGATTLRRVYGADLPEAEAIHAFSDRMRRQRVIQNASSIAGGRKAITGHICPASAAPGAAPALRATWAGPLG